MDSTNAKLQAAFQVECVEHLEAIRASVERLAVQDGADPGDLEDAFRRAHSLKGAARLTGATQAEQIAHRLEELFSQLKGDTLHLNRDVLDVVQAALDGIEDCTTCLAKSAAPADTQTLLATLDRTIGAQAVAPAPRPRTEINERLRVAFAGEYPEYLTRIRAVLERAQHRAGSPSAAELEDAFHCAHSLKGAARVANVVAVDQLAERLEGLFHQVRQGQATLDEATVAEVHRCLAVIEGHAAATATYDGPSHDTADVLPSKPPMDGPGAESATQGPRQPAGKATHLPQNPVDSVRLNAGHLDQLLQSTGELFAEGWRQQTVAQQLVALHGQIAGLEREWQTLKKAAGLNGRNAASIPQRVRQSVDAVENHLHSLSRNARSARLLQRRAAASLGALADRIQRDVKKTRLVSAESMFQGFRKMVRDLARDEGKQVEFRMSGLQVDADRMVLQALKDPLMHVLRNAVTHGIERPTERLSQGKPSAGVVLLNIEVLGNRLIVSVEDDGHGLDLEQAAQVAVRRRFVATDAAETSRQDLIRLLFRPGFSTARQVTELSGRGIGLSVVQDAVARLQGEVELQPRESGGTLFRVNVPLTISTHRLLLVSCRDQTYAIPFHGVESLHRVKSGEVTTVEGLPMVPAKGRLLQVAALSQILGLEETTSEACAGNIDLVVLRSGPNRIAVVVDALLAERDALIKPLGKPIDRMRAFSGGILLGDGAVALVLNPTQLIEDFRPIRRTVQTAHDESADAPPATILVVDDSITTRTLETSILQAHGYTVRVAVDGVEALSHLRSQRIDLVITDVQMPRLDGFGLLEEIKKDQRLAQIPVIVVSSLDRREDRERGLSLGADAYIAKRKFDHQDLLQTIEQLL